MLYIASTMPHVRYIFFPPIKAEVRCTQYAVKQHNYFLMLQFVPGITEIYNMGNSWGLFSFTPYWSEAVIIFAMIRNTFCYSKEHNTMHK